MHLRVQRATYSAAKAFAVLCREENILPTDEEFRPFYDKMTSMFQAYEEALTEAELDADLIAWWEANGEEVMAIEAVGAAMLAH
jgi:hypothetical protein